MNKKKILVLLDSHAILHRAYHALPDFTSPKTGEPTGALYGFSAMLIKIMKELQPDYVAACFDLPKPTFRHIAYEDYKAHRPKTDDALSTQITRSRDILEAFGIPLYEKEGFEADDALGTIVDQIQKTKDKKLQTIIASGDMDTTQLVVGDSVVVYTLRKGIQDTIIYNEKAVEERYGFKPQLLPDYKGLCGDPSDNIVGVPGIGAKTATLLIQKFGTIENIYKNLAPHGGGEKKKKGEEIFLDAGFKPRMIKILLENEEEALFSKELALIRRDVPIKFSLEKSAFHNFSEEKAKEKIKKMFAELGFNSLIKRFEVPILPPTKSEKQNRESSISQPNQRGLGEIGKETGNKIEKLYQDKVLSKEVYEIEKKLAPVVSEMEKNGVLIDTKFLQDLSVEYHKKAKSIEKKIWKLAEVEFNIDSPKQLAEILFEKMNISTKGIKKTAGGVLSTKASELEKLKNEHEIIEKIIDYREIRKLITTYVDPLPNLVGKDGRLHAKFDPLGTATGRFSSSEPNLQNIPIKNELGRNIRKAFVAPKGKKLVAFDYSQIELRILAILSNDEYLKKVFSTGGDIHASVASKVFSAGGGSASGGGVKEVTPEMRRKAKVINFGIIYGMGVSALQKNLGTTRQEAQEFYDNYFKNFPEVFAYRESLKEKVYNDGYTETLLGRRRYFADIKHRVVFVQKEMERAAVNHPLQGTSADIIKIAMVNIEKRLQKNSLGGHIKLILQIHDELVYEVDEREIKQAIDIIKEEMEVVLKEKTKGVPLSVDVSMGNNWNSLEKYL